MSKQQLEITLYPRKVAATLGAIMIFLVLVHLITNSLEWLVESDFTYGLARFFNLDTERNIPTFFAICLWMINAVLFFAVWKTQGVKNKVRRIWLILSGLFCFLAIDELSSFHESLAPYLGSALGTSGIFYFAWIIPYGIGAVLLSILMIPIVWKFDQNIRFWFGLSAVTFVTGAIGFEMLEGWYLQIMNNQKDIVYYCLMTFEESMEMAGLVMLVYASLLLLQKECGGFSIHFPASRRAPVYFNKPDANEPAARLHDRDA